MKDEVFTMTFAKAYIKIRVERNVKWLDQFEMKQPLFGSVELDDPMIESFVNIYDDICSKMDNGERPYDKSVVLMLDDIVISGHFQEL